MMKNFRGKLKKNCGFLWCSALRLTLREHLNISMTLKRALSCTGNNFLFSQIIQKPKVIKFTICFYVVQLTELV